MKRLVSVALMAVGLPMGACQPPAGAEAQQPAAQRDVRAQLGPIADIDTATAFRLSNTFRAAADRALPAVVYIAVLREARPMAQQGPRPSVPDDLFRFFSPQNPFGMEQPPQQGAGSGFIIDGSGHVMTNHHVVAGATRITVRLVDGREYDARLVGSDAATDVAILKVEPRGGEALPVATLGSSDDLRIGDWVIALGNPLGLSFTVTAGIVSAKGRQLRPGSTPGEGGAPPLEAFVQTDAAINPGNSGGPLVDLFGRVVAVNTAISARNFIGHGFAVPIDIASRVADDLMAHGYVRRPRIGVTVSDVQQVDAEVYGLRDIRGAQITSVQPGQPGEAAGLRPGDVVLAIDGRPIADATDLTTTLARRQPGETVEFTVWRDRATTRVNARLGEFPRPDGQRAPTEVAARASDRVGFSVIAVTAEQAARLGLPREAGLVIDAVAEFGPAAGRVAPRAGGAPQMLRSINGQPVRTEAEFENVVRRLSAGDAVSLRVVDRELGEMVVNFRVR
jgi:serine protease Do